MLKKNLLLLNIASGSKGNCTYLSDGETSILFDLGISTKSLEARLAEKKIDINEISAVVLSHEHQDHIKGVGPFCRKYGACVYSNKATFEKSQKTIKKIKKVMFFESGFDFFINKLKIHPFPISHDAVDPVGFTIKRGFAKVGLATDVGFLNSLVKERLKNCCALVVEANHDSLMLQNGSYQWFLKQRIKGRCGHMSNEDLKNLLISVKHKNLQYVLLAHLSTDNNKESIALSFAKEALQDFSHVQISVAQQDQISQMIKIKF